MVRMWIARFFQTKLSRELVGLYYFDHTNWKRGTHRVVHQPTEIAIWTANSVYGLHVEEPGKPDFKPCWADRVVLFNTFKNDPVSRCDGITNRIELYLQHSQDAAE